jgi:hypothetical protein
MSADKLEELAASFKKLEAEVNDLRSRAKQPYTRIYCDVAVLDDCVIWHCNSLMPQSDKSLSCINFEERYEVANEVPTDQVEATNWCNGLMAAINAGLQTISVGEIGSRIYIQHRDTWFATALLNNKNPFLIGSKLYEKFQALTDAITVIGKPLIFQPMDEQDHNWKLTVKRLHYEVRKYIEWYKDQETFNDTICNGEYIHPAISSNPGEEV